MSAQVQPFKVGDRIRAVNPSHSRGLPHPLRLGNEYTVEQAYGDGDVSLVGFFGITSSQYFEKGTEEPQNNFVALETTVVKRLVPLAAECPEGLNPAYFNCNLTDAPSRCVSFAVNTGVCSPKELRVLSEYLEKLAGAIEEVEGSQGDAA